jgi:hypothetical protein
MIEPDHLPDPQCRAMEVRPVRPPAPTPLIGQAAISKSREQEIPNVPV